jgi:hypothetical protein
MASRAWDTLEKKDFELCTTKVWSKVFLNVIWKSIFVNIAYMEKKLVRFPSGETREKGILELVHSDVFGHVKIPSLGGSMYYVSFIDDFSRKTWIYFLRKKS